MPCFAKLAVPVLFLASIFSPSAAELEDKKKHHHHHHAGRGHHAHHHSQQHQQTAHSNTSAAAAANTAILANASRQDSQHHSADPVAFKEKQIIDRMRQLEKDLAIKGLSEKGHFLVNGPLPVDFGQRFAQGVASATGCKTEEVKVLSITPRENGRVDEIVFQAPQTAALAAERQAADPDSKLANGPLRMLLLARDDGDEAKEAKEAKEDKKDKNDKKAKEDKDVAEEAEDTEEGEANHVGGPAPAPAVFSEEESPTSEEAPQQSVLDIDTQMPFGDLEPFGREDTAQELTESSIAESDRMVDQLERAEVAEEKRAVFRALTRLRGAAITSFDGVARSQTGNIDEYNKVHQWRKTHPLRHLAQEESDISKWAFPDANF